MREIERIAMKVITSCAMAATLAVAVALTYPNASSAEVSQTAVAAAPLPRQTDVNRAKHHTDAEGVPLLDIKGVGEVRHPAWTALYALNYAGIEVYDPSLGLQKDHEKFEACIRWLSKNLTKGSTGVWAWHYSFDSTYNDVSIKAPWISAFSQAVGIQALLAAYHIDGNQEALRLAQKAAVALVTPIDRGGLLFSSGQDVWFEEIPSNAKNPSHILNGDMRALLALKELNDVVHDPEIDGYIKRGADTLYRWLPRYDAGYWFRYDLNPKKDGLLFKFANPYGFAIPHLAIDKIELLDPVSGRSVALDVGSNGDASGEIRIAGTGWGQPQSVAGRTARELDATSQINTEDSTVGKSAYFYLKLPNQWKENLRSIPYELVVTYYDSIKGNVAVQQRSIAPGVDFRDLRSGDLLLTGSKKWRTWRIPIHPSDLGYWVGNLYAKKHWEYLSAIAKWDGRFISWSKTAAGYFRLVQEETHPHLVRPAVASPPAQTAIIRDYPFDKSGVIRQRISEPGSDSDGSLRSSTKTRDVYSPYLISQQLMYGGKLPGVPDDSVPVSGIDPQLISKLPALRWLTNPNNYRSVNDAAIYYYPFKNVYNNVVMQPGWASSFAQANVVDAFLSYANQHSGKSIDSDILKAALAFNVPVSLGGFTSVDRAGYRFYEEVPNSTHILNAHLASIPALYEAGRYLRRDDIVNLSLAGIDSLKRYLNEFDTGYWLRYDLNPKRDLLFQIDWLRGKVSPLISDIQIIDPIRNEAVRVDVGGDQAFDGPGRISGTEWQAGEVIDGKTARGFDDGYTLHDNAVQGGTRQNTYFSVTLPEAADADLFATPTYKLKITYKDVAKGVFDLKVRSINQGNKLSFIPLRGGVLKTVGDGSWKTAVFFLRPQDIGWYKGADYQKFEIAQLIKVANITNDWFFYQYAWRQQYFLNSFEAGKDVIVEDHIHSDHPASRNALLDVLNRWWGRSLSWIEDGADRHRSSSEKGDYLAPDSLANPLSSLGLPVTNDIKKLSDEISKGVSTDNERILAFMTYLDRLRIEPEASIDPDSTLASGVGACGTLTSTLLAFAASQGMKGRYVNFYNYPRGDGHIAAEIFVQGKWRLYDPTYDTYYVSRTSPQLGPLSYSEVASAYRSDSGDIRRVSRTYRDGMDEFTGRNIFINANPSGPIGRDIPMTFPLVLTYPPTRVVTRAEMGPRY